MRPVTNTLFACLAFLTMAAALRWLMPVALTADQREEEHTLRPRGECTVLFLGPSYVKQIDLRAFDAAASRLGFEARACKLGRSSLRGVELERELDSLLNYPWPNLKLVVVDVTLDDTIEFKERNWFKRRLVDWHDWQGVNRLVRFFTRDRRPWQKQAREVWAHARHLMANYVVLGRGADWLATLTTHREREVDSIPPKRRGEYTQRLRRLKWARHQQRRKPTYESSSWPLELRKRIRSHGYEAVFLYAPVWRVKRLPARAVVGRERLTYLDFADPDRYPELYIESARGTTHHLTPSAYKPYSKRIAEELGKRGLLGP
jgi:hypothetical protein